jgi:DNA-binding response OmpR family regulator
METILIVEDDKTIAESICFILEKDSFNCKWFDNGKEALEFHKDNEVDLILLDVGLPDMSGFDLLRKVREKSNLPVIIISARDAEFKILSHLVKNPNRVHSREYLMSIIWDRPHGSDIKTINTHIKSIRKRLHELDETNEYIETHRGIGYSLIE